MLTASAAFAELRSRNSQTVGASALQRRLDIGSLFEVYKTQIRRISNTQYELDVPDGYLESAWIGDWEAAYDIALQQAGTYLHSEMAGRSPAWSAVTGYYAGFFAARALLYAVGIGHRSLPRLGVMNGGLYELKVRPGATVGQSTLVCISQGGGGSHKAAWKQIQNLIQELLSVGGLDMLSLGTLTSMHSLVSTPRHVSAYRNSVNYSLDIAAAPVQHWANELRRIGDESQLQTAIASAGPMRDENRIELLLLGCLSWMRNLYVEYLLRADRPDRRRSRARGSLIAAEDEDVAEILRRWF